MAYSSVAHSIARATAMLTSMNETAPLCPFGQPTERSKTFENIVSRFFIGDVQPWLVALRQRKEVLLAPVQQLEATYRVMHRAAVAEVFHEVGIQKGQRQDEPLQGAYVIQVQDADQNDRDAG